MRIKALLICSILSLAVVTTANAQGGRGGRGGFGGPGMFGRGGSIFMIAGNETVQKDLALSTDATDKVKKVTDEFGAAMRESRGDMQGFRDMSQEERQKAMDKMAETNKTLTAKFLPKLKEAVSTDQFARLQQIQWQVMGSSALAEDDVIKSLTISKEQQDKIKSVNTEFDGKRGELFAGGGGGGDREAMREKMQEIDKARDTKINEILSKEQQDKFTSIKGKAFDVAALRPQGRGPGGGGGGGGGRPKRPQQKAE